MNTDLDGAAPSRRPHPVPCRGARIQFTNGRAVLGQRTPTPPGWLAPLASIVSPGTELRHLAATCGYNQRFAGYMTIARRADELVVAAAPHGAAIPASDPGLLPVADAVGVDCLTAARFALIASAGLDLLPAGALSGEILLVGSGPVALGCALELRRRGAEHIRVLTGRLAPPVAQVPGVEIVRRAESAWCVIDAAGRLEAALSATCDGGVLGLLATPSPTAAVPALAAHRSGLSVVGMHELVGYDHQIYTQRLTAITTWLGSAISADHLHSWCRHVPEGQTAQLYELLAGPERPVEPFLILDWVA